MPFCISLIEDERFYTADAIKDGKMTGVNAMIAQVNKGRRDRISCCSSFANMVVHFKIAHLQMRISFTRYLYSVDSF